MRARARDEMIQLIRTEIR